MTFRPILKPDHKVPFEYMRACPECGYMTFCIHMKSSDLHIKCINGFCPRWLAREPLPCILKHREYQKTNFQFVVQDAVAFQPDGLLNPFDDVMQPSEIAGPYENCKGALQWGDGETPKSSAFVFCSGCKARYHIFALATYGNAVGDDDGVLYHNMYRLMKTRDGGLKVVEKWKPDDEVYRIPLDRLLICDEIVWEGERVTESEPFFGEEMNKLIF